VVVILFLFANGIAHLISLFGPQFKSSKNTKLLNEICDLQ
jgi:hypothetical protein